MILGRPVDIEQLRDWITSIPFDDWPQQHRIDDQLRPAMVTDLEWHGFGKIAAPVEASIMARFFADNDSYQWMLSVVMPGHSIPPHVDGQAKNWKCRVHVPLVSNDQSSFAVNGIPYCLNPGCAYTVDTTVEHAVTNNGIGPRIHFMFDVGKK